MYATEGRESLLLFFAPLLPKRKPCRKRTCVAFKATAGYCPGLRAFRRNAASNQYGHQSIFPR